MKDLAQRYMALIAKRPELAVELLSYRRYQAFPDPSVRYGWFRGAEPYWRSLSEDEAAALIEHKLFRELPPCVGVAKVRDGFSLITSEDNCTVWSEAHPSALEAMLDYCETGDEA